MNEVCRADDVALAITNGVVLPDNREAIGVAVGKRLQQQRVDDAEDGGVGGDADGQRGDGDEGEAGGPSQCAQSVAKIGEE